MTRELRHVSIISIFVIYLVGTTVASANPALYQPMAPPTLSGTNVAWNYTMGYAFTPKKNISVTSLGGTFYGTKTVALYDGSTVMANATVAGAGTTYAYTSLLHGVALLANHTYTIGVWLNGSGGNYYTASTNLLGMSNNDITITQSCFIANSTANPCTGSATLATVYGVPDFLYTGGSGLTCQEITLPGFYTLTGDILTTNSGGTSSNCLYVHNLPSGPATTIDCQYHSIMGGTDSANVNGKAILVKAVNNTTGVIFKNCKLDSPSEYYPVDIESSSIITVTNSTIGHAFAQASYGTVLVNHSSYVNLTSNVVYNGDVDSKYSTYVNVSGNQINCATWHGMTAGILFTDGLNNIASWNTIIGNWDGVPYPNAKGCDDGIYVVREGDDNFNNNNITNVWDVGIETEGLIYDSHFDYNTFSYLNGFGTAGAGSGIGGWYTQSLSGNTFIGNTVDHSVHMFDFHLDAHPGGPFWTAYYFQNNTFSNNTGTNLTAPFDSFGGPSVPATSFSPPVPVYEVNNVFTGNNWGAGRCPPYFYTYPVTTGSTGQVTDGGGNTCTQNTSLCSIVPTYPTEPILCH